MNINWKRLLIFIMLTFFIGSFFAIFINNSNLYNSINNAIEIPNYIFPIVWSILYLLMGISIYIVMESKSINKSKAINIYILQLLVNSTWTLLFFGFKLYILSFIWIILLIVLVIIMIYRFYNINKLSGLLNLPYLVWLIFAAYLSFFVIILN
ncbi:MAG: TspO/MBR family protein [Bacilli bacterium]